MYKVNELLSAKYIQSSPYGSSNGDLKVYVPSLMSKISMGLPKSTPVSLNKSCYINANDCKPAVASKISTQNFITAKASYNSYKYPRYGYGSSLKIQVKTEDGLICKLSPEDEDNSITY